MLIFHFWIWGKAEEPVEYQVVAPSPSDYEKYKALWDRANVLSRKIANFGVWAGYKGYKKGCRRLTAEQVDELLTMTEKALGGTQLTIASLLNVDFGKYL